MFIVEEQLQSLALDDQRIEWRENMDRPLRRRAGGARLGRDPVLDLFGALDRHGGQSSCARSCFNKPAGGLLAAGVEMKGGVEADQSLRAQRSIDEIVQHLPLGGGLWPMAPAEMPLDQLVGLEHAGSFADRQNACKKGELKRAFRGLSAGPSVILFYQDIVVDIANCDGAVLANKVENFAQVLRLDGAKPGPRRAPMTPHLRKKETNVASRCIG